MKHWNEGKAILLAVIGMAGSTAAKLLGGWDSVVATLVVFMGIDYGLGLVLAGVFHKSPKSQSGALESKAGFKGLCRKGCTLLFVLIGHRLDLVLELDYIRTAVIVGFLANELISIVENAGLMGLPMPKVITQAVDLLNQRNGGKL